MPSQSSPASGDDAIQPLRDALSHSPNNVPLRQHLADTLLSHNRGEEAEKEYREALAQSPDNVALQLGKSLLNLFVIGSIVFMWGANVIIPIQPKR
jgi:predicted Zn-dependent protease